MVLKTYTSFYNQYVGLCIINEERFQILHSLFLTRFKTKILIKLLGNFTLYVSLYFKVCLKQYFLNVCRTSLM